MSTEKLLRKVDPELATSNLIISKTFQKQSDVESSMRASATGKGAHRRHRLKAPSRTACALALRHDCPLYGRQHAKNGDFRSPFFVGAVCEGTVSTP